MIYLRLAGGLGNQLYQIAAASLLAKHTGVPVVPYTQSLQNYAEARLPDSLELLMENNWLHLASDSGDKTINWLTVSARVGRWMPHFGVNDKNFWHIIADQNKSKIFILDGYFQHGWSHQNFNEALDAMPVRPVSKTASALIRSNEVVIHIRGGDFLKLPRFQVVGLSYYLRTVRLAMKQGWRCFAIMTDDRAYANLMCEQMARELSGLSFRVLPRTESALDDFDILRAASARIIGNSTFAWWAAALGQAESPTWTPTMLTVDEPRDFYLPFEIPIEEVYS